MIEKILPESEDHWLKLRLMDVTSTEVAALFGISPYVTLFELWHRKKQQAIIRLQANARTVWGTRLEESIARGVAEDQGWQIRNVKEYIRDSELRMGSSFDFMVVEPVLKDIPGVVPGKSVVYYDSSKVKPSELYMLQDSAILEIKNVDGLVFRNEWNDEGSGLEAPPHIEIQVQHQLALAGLPVAYIAALVGGNDVRLIKREPDLAVIAAIKKKVREFWDSIEKNHAPTPDFKKDAAFISRMYNFAEPGKVIDADDRIRQLAEEYKHYSVMQKDAEGLKEAAKAEILTMLGDAEKCLHPQFTISASLVGPAEVSYTREGYRSFRVHWRKTK